MIWERKELSLKRQELAPLRKYHVLGKGMFREAAENIILQTMPLSLGGLGHEKGMRLDQLRGNE